jgi:hypothetical protein
MPFVLSLYVLEGNRISWPGLALRMGVSQFEVHIPCKRYDG